ASRAFSRRSVSAGHGNLPSASPQSLGGIRVRFWRPVRIMILISVLFVGLGYDPTRFQLNLSFLQHQGMLAARPILDRRESEPIRSAILRFAMGWMTGGQVFVGVPSHQQRSGFVSPFLIPETVQVISQVPRNIRESGQPRDGVTDITPFVLAPGGRLSFVRGDFQNRRDNHIAVPRIAEHPLTLLPISDVEAREVDLRVVETVRR